MRRPSPEYSGPTIKKLTIPDRDVSGWFKTLHDGGFSTQEIDRILSRLNATYAAHLKPEQRRIQADSLVAEINAVRRQRGEPDLAEEELADMLRNLEKLLKTDI